MGSGTDLCFIWKKKNSETYLTCSIKFLKKNAETHLTCSIQVNIQKKTQQPLKDRFIYPQN